MLRISVGFPRLALTGMLLMLGCLLLGSCASGSPVICQRLESDVLRGDFPRTVAVLPFQDLTGTEGLASVVRGGFYSRFSTLPYRDVELSLIDLRLKEHGISDRKALDRTPVARLGRILGCDAVIFGTIYDFQRIFAGVYSSLSVGASITVWDTRTGRKIWTDRFTARSHEGGLPLTLLDLPFITLRSGLNLTDSVKIQAVDELSRRLSMNIPAPPKAVSEIHLHKYELQAGAFSESARALQFQNALKTKGYAAYIRKSTDPHGEIWHRVLVGPFTDRNAALQAKQEVDRLFSADCFVTRHNS